MRRQENNYHVIPRQKRSRAAESRIVAATAQLIETVDYPDLTVARIVYHAETSTGAFYRRFSSKEALLALLYRKYTRSQSARHLLAGARRGSRRSLALTCKRITYAIVGEHRKHRGLLRATALALEAHPEQFSPAVNFLYPPLCAQAASLFEPHMRSIGHADPRAAVEFGLSAVVSACRARILFGSDLHISEPSPAGDALMRELTRMLFAYLANTGREG